MSELKDPRVLLASERTLLAWGRTSISLMAFGFLVERVSLFPDFIQGNADFSQQPYSFFIGISFILLASFTAMYSVWQHKEILKTLQPEEVPTSYKLGVSMWVNGLIAMLGIFLSATLAIGYL